MFKSTREHGTTHYSTVVHTSDSYMADPKHKTCPVR